MLAFVNVAVSFSPTRVAYSDLTSTSHELRGVLERDGVVAIADVPGFKAAREEALGAASRCVATHPGASSRTFHDGTVRRTLAAVPETNILPSPSAGASCATFEAAATSLRAATADATAAFSAALGRGRPARAALDADDEDVTISQMLDNAEVLEHFHSYTLPRAAAPTGLRRADVDVHTDQGIFVAFTPALVAGASSPSDAATFVIEQPGGRRVAAELDPHTLIFMLGDGIEQLVNPHLRAAGRSPLRPVPHAVEMRARADGAARAWYGRMVLPPAALIAPDHGGATYGRVRELLKAGTTGDDDGVALGCSRDTASRRMQWAPAVPECAEGTMYCWHRCMNLTGDTLLDHPHPVHGDYFPFGPDATDCAARGLQTQCVDALDTLPPSSQHGDFFPACTNTTKPRVSLAISTRCRGEAARRGAGVGRRPRGGRRGVRRDRRGLRVYRRPARPRRQLRGRVGRVGLVCEARRIRGEPGAVGRVRRRLGPAGQPVPPRRPRVEGGRRDCPREDGGGRPLRLARLRVREPGGAPQRDERRADRDGDAGRRL